MFGRGRVDGRNVIVSSDEFTLRGGSAVASIWERFKLAERLAFDIQIPLIRLVEGSGGCGSVKSIEKAGHANLPGGLGGQSGGFHLCCTNLAAVPVVTLALGSVHGTLGAARLCASHYSIMVKPTSAVFVAGPPVVERLGEKRIKQELGRYAVQLASGTVDHASRERSLRPRQTVLSYLPSSVWQLPEQTVPADDPHRRDEQPLTIVPREPRRAYHMRKIVDSLCHRSSFFELAPQFGHSMITGFADSTVGRLRSWQETARIRRAWTAATAQKIVRFVDLTELFHLPIVHLVDSPGFQVGLEAEKSGVMRHAVGAIAAIHQSTVPWCSIIVRNVFGVGCGHISLKHIPRSAMHGLRGDGNRFRWKVASRPPIGQSSMQPAIVQPNIRK